MDIKKAQFISQNSQFCTKMFVFRFLRRYIGANLISFSEKVFVIVYKSCDVNASRLHSNNSPLTMLLHHLPSWAVDNAADIMSEMKLKINIIIFLHLFLCKKSYGYKKSQVHLFIRSTNNYKKRCLCFL